MNAGKADHFSGKIGRFIRKNKWLILLVGAGILLLLLTSGLTQKPAQTTKNEEDFCREYTEDLEARLGKIVCRIADVKECSVMVTLKSGMEYQYATDANRSSSGEAKAQSEEKVTVVSDKEKGEKAVIVTEYYPQIGGVTVICSAPKTAALTLELKNAVATALGIDSGKVCIILKG